MHDGLLTSPYGDDGTTTHRVAIKSPRPPTRPSSIVSAMSDLAEGSDDAEGSDGGGGGGGAVARGDSCASTGSRRSSLERARRNSDSFKRSNEDDLLAEAALMSGFRHPHIVALVGVVTRDTRSPCKVVMQLCGRGSLQSVLRRGLLSTRNGEIAETVRAKRSNKQGNVKMRTRARVFS